MKWTILVSLIAAFAFAQEGSYQDEVSTSRDSLSEYQSNYKLRQDRKVGAGIGVGGALGGFGGLVELNIEDINSALIGFGTGPGYQTMNISWKQSFEGEYFTPYTTAGYSHWWDSGSKSEARKSSLLKNFLSEDQRQKHSFGLDLLTGSLGMQYNQLAGDFAGSSFYLEIGGLLSLQNTKLMPTGSVGALYYF
jgi:hypothetical protein